MLRRCRKSLDWAATKVPSDEGERDTGGEVVSRGRGAILFCGDVLLQYNWPNEYILNETSSRTALALECETLVVCLISAVETEKVV